MKVSGTAPFALAARRSFSKDRLLDGTTLTSRTSTTTGEHHSAEPAMLPAEIEQLADLSGFLKLASRPEWLKIQIRECDTRALLEEPKLPLLDAMRRPVSLQEVRGLLWELWEK